MSSRVQNTPTGYRNAFPARPGDSEKKLKNEENIHYWRTSVFEEIDFPWYPKFKPTLPKWPLWPWDHFMVLVKKWILLCKYQSNRRLSGKTHFLYFIYKKAVSKEFKEMHGSCISKEQSGIPCWQPRNEFWMFAPSAPLTTGILWATTGTGKTWKSITEHFANLTATLRRSHACDRPRPQHTYTRHTCLSITTF